MKKSLIVLIVVLSLVACTPAKKYTFTWLAPKGAPSVALIPLINEAVDAIELVDGTDVISAALIQGEKDVIIAPLNLGAKLIQSGDAAYQLLSIVTWGNLYVVKDDAVAFSNNMELAMFGTKAVPELILNQVADQLPFTFTKVPFNSVVDVKSQLVTKTYAMGLLAEPIATATIAAAKAQGITLSIVADLQALWKTKTGVENYPQAALFVRKDLTTAQIAQIKESVESMVTYVTLVKADPNLVETDITNLTAERIGVPSAAIVKATWNRLNIDVQYATDVKNEIATFLALFNLTLDSKNVVSK